MEDEDTVASFTRPLIERLNENMADYFDGLRGLDSQTLLGMMDDIGAMAQAHHYLTKDYDFRFEDVRYLLNFRKPLRVVADGLLASGMEFIYDALWETLARQDALIGNYEFMPGPEDATLRETLFKRLDRNLSVSMAEYREEVTRPGVSDVELGSAAERIVAVCAAYEFLKEYFYEPGDAAYLLRFEYPLRLIADALPAAPRGLGEMYEAVREFLEKREDRMDVQYALPDCEAKLKSSQIQRRDDGVTLVSETLKRARESPPTAQSVKRKRSARAKSAPEL
jgi:hypothetical protein